MKLSIISLLGAASLISASPVNSATSSPVKLLANCNNSIGNCYANGCNGNPTTLVCTSGSYVGCPCGYDCKGANPCNQNGCNGRNGRCTANYLGCACT